MRVWQGQDLCSGPTPAVGVKAAVGFSGGRVVKNPPANAGNTRDAGWVPGSEGYLEVEMVIHSSIFASKIPWTEELGGLEFMGSQTVGHD